MQNKVSHKVIAIFMALLMFSSSIGISMDMHFCGNELQSVSFIGDAEPCEMMQPKQEKKSDKSCCDAPKKEIKNCSNQQASESNCCHNENLVLESGGVYDTSDISLEQFQKALTAVIILLPNFNLFRVSNEKVNYADYSPPPLIKDISILHQVFRI